MNKPTVMESAGLALCDRYEEGCWMTERRLGSVCSAGILHPCCVSAGMLPWAPKTHHTG